MSLTCLILSFNHPDLTSRCIRSARNFFSDAAIHLIHNGSLEKNIELLRENFPHIQHHILPKNKGFSGGANFGLRQLQKTNNVLFLTNDCELESLPDFPKHDGVYAPLILKRKTNQVDSLGGFFHPSQGKLQHLKTENDWAPGPDAHIYVPGTAFLLIGRALQEFIPFDEELGTYWEDVDFSLRMHNKGFSLLPYPTIRIRHGVGKTCHKDAFYTSYLFQRNRRKVSRYYVAQNWQAKLRLEITLIRDLLRAFVRACARRDFKRLRYVLLVLRDSF